MGTPIFAYANDITGSSYFPILGNTIALGDGGLYTNSPTYSWSWANDGTLTLVDAMTKLEAHLEQAVFNSVPYNSWTVALINGKVRITLNSYATDWQWFFTNVGDNGVSTFWGLASEVDIQASSSVYTFPYKPRLVWYPERGADEDTRNRYMYSGGVAKTLSGVRRVTKYVAAPKQERVLTFRYVTAENALMEYEPGTPELNSFERFWYNASSGYPIDMADDASNPTWVRYVVTDMSDPLKRSSGYKVYWDVTLRLAKV